VLKSLTRLAQIKFYIKHIISAQAIAWLCDTPINLLVVNCGVDQLWGADLVALGIEAFGINTIATVVRIIAALLRRDNG
jgi:hypothetical protein